MAKDTKAAAAPAAQGQTTWQVRMVKDKVTKNALRYAEVEQEGVAPRIGQLYVQKHALPGAPEEILVSVSVGV